MTVVDKIEDGYNYYSSKVITVKGQAMPDTRSLPEHTIAIQEYGEFPKMWVVHKGVWLAIGEMFTQNQPVASTSASVTTVDMNVSNNLTVGNNAYIGGGLVVGNPTTLATGMLRWTGSWLEIYNGTTWEILNTGNISDNYTGFIDRTHSTIAFNNTTKVFTIAPNTPTYTSYKIYYKSIEYTISTAQTVTLTTAAAGDVWFIYFDGTGTLIASKTAWTFDLIMVATVYWNGVEGIIGEERHGLMQPIVHELIHNTIGSRYNSGFTGTFNTGTTSITAGSFYDEDIKHSTSSTATTIRVFYRNGSVFLFTAPQASYFVTVAGKIQHDKAGVMTEVTSSEWVAYWIFATNDPTYPFYSMMGQRVDTTLANARANNTYESLSFTTLPSKEYKLLYRILLKGTAGTYTETQDMRSVSNLPAGTYVATSHSILTGLASDDHTQYLLLAGRSGQTVTDSVTFDNLAIGTSPVLRYIGSGSSRPASGTAGDVYILSGRISVWDGTTWIDG